MSAMVKRFLSTTSLVGTENAALTSKIFIDDNQHTLLSKTSKMTSVNNAVRHLSEPS